MGTGDKRVVGNVIAAPGGEVDGTPGGAALVRRDPGGEGAGHVVDDDDIELPGGVAQAHRAAGTVSASSKPAR